MFNDQKDLAISFYNQALFDYVDIVEDYFDILNIRNTPDQHARSVQSAKLKKSFDKITMVVRIADIKFGLKFRAPLLCFRSSEMMQ